jgi:acetyltransferase-like isoleucine patch superfamily enzyme
MFRTLKIWLSALLPGRRLRLAAYRWLLGYDISADSSIGWLNLLDLSECHIVGGRIGHFNEIRACRLTMMPGAVIGRFNRFKSANRISLGSGSEVVSRNRFMGTRPGLSPFSEHENFTLGDRSVIVAGHYFDLSDNITMGSNVTVGGRNSEFWTHGFDLNRVKVQAPIHIGDDCYMGSRCLVMPGVVITGRVSIGAGTTVSRSITESGMYVSSQLIRKGDVPDFTGEVRIVEHRGARFWRRTSS